MWYILPDSNKQYPVPIERVRKIKQQNSQGIIPLELEAVEVTSQKPKEVEPEFVDVVGQISLRTLEKAEKKKRHHPPQTRHQPNKPAPPNRPRRDDRIYPLESLYRLILFADQYTQTNKTVLQNKEAE